MSCCCFSCLKELAVSLTGFFGWKQRRVVYSKVPYDINDSIFNTPTSNGRPVYVYKNKVFLDKEEEEKAEQEYPMLPRDNEDNEDNEDKEDQPTINI